MMAIYGNNLAMYNHTWPYYGKPHIAICGHNTYVAICQTLQLQAVGKLGSRLHRPPAGLVLGRDPDEQYVHVVAQLIN